MGYLRLQKPKINKAKVNPVVSRNRLYVVSVSFASPARVTTAIHTIKIVRNIDAYRIVPQFFNLDYILKMLHCKAPGFTFRWLLYSKAKIKIEQE